MFSFNVKIYCDKPIKQFKIMNPFKKWLKHVLYYDFNYFLNKTFFKKVAI